MWALGDKKQSHVGDDDNFTFLGKGVDFKGVVSFDGTVRIDGRLEGEIHTTGMLVVGEHAVVKGIISAGTLVTSGKINGTVTAVEKIQILKPGVLIGDVRTPAVSIEEGSHFHGMCDMGAHKWIEEQSATPKPVHDKHIHDLASHRGKVRANDQ
ncbi:MAG: bactofilin family protein [Nitrospiraceae bacterium]